MSVGFVGSSRIQVPILSHDILKKETSNRRHDSQSVFSQ